MPTRQTTGLGSQNRVRPRMTHKQDWVLRLSGKFYGGRFFSHTLIHIYSFIVTMTTYYTLLEAYWKYLSSQEQKNYENPILGCKGPKNYFWERPIYYLFGYNFFFFRSRELWQSFSKANLKFLTFHRKKSWKILILGVASPKKLTP